MMFEIRRPTNGIPVRRANWAAMVSPTSFDSAYDVSGRGSIVSSMGANAGGVSNGNPSTVSDDAHTTRRMRWSSAAANTWYVESALTRNVSPAGRRSDAGMAARWTTASNRAQRIERLAEVREIREERRPGLRAVAHDVDVPDLVAVLAELTHDPAAGLAAAAGHDHPHHADFAASSRGAWIWASTSSRVASMLWIVRP